MKNIIKTLGIIALVAIIGFALTGCKEKQDSDLVYKWYETEAAAAADKNDYVYWFKSDGKVNMYGAETLFKWSTKKKKLTITGSEGGLTISMTMNYKVSGKKLTLSDITGGGSSTSLTLYKK